MEQKFENVSFNAAASKFSMESNLATFYFKPINGIFQCVKSLNKQRSLILKYTQIVQVVLL